MIGCALETINELGAGFLESVCEKSLALVVEKKGLSTQTQIPLNSRTDLAGVWLSSMQPIQRVLK